MLIWSMGGKLIVGKIDVLGEKINKMYIKNGVRVYGRGSVGS